MSAVLRCGFVVLATMAAGAAIPAAGDSDFFLRDGDTVVALGDSITEQRLYSDYLEMWTVARFPSWRIVFRNVGIGRDTAAGGNDRFKRDVLSHGPTALTVNFGINDGGSRPFEEKRYKAYLGALQGIADQARDAKLRVAWLTPSPVERSEDGPALAGYNQTLERLSAGVREIASGSGGLFVDLFHPMIEAQDRARAANPRNRIGGGGYTHPGPPGHALMAYAILKGLRLPTLVTAVEIDAASRRVVRAARCRVTGVRAQAGGLTFQRTDEALPFFPEEASSILEWAQIRDELNDYRLKVTRLKPGRYEVRLGGTTVAEVSADEMAAGVNLAAAALAAGPVAEQVRQVWSAVQAKNRYYHGRIFRGVVLAEVQIPEFLDLDLTPAAIEAKRQAVLAERLLEMPRLDAAIGRALTPRPHRVDIVPVVRPPAPPTRR